MNRELKTLSWILALFAVAYMLPVGSPRMMSALSATVDLIHWYAREHVVLCLFPAFFIAGVISVYVSQGSILKYFGANANRWLSYSVASVSGGILAVCSCTILPLFTGIYRRGAGIGPAVAFLYSGPAISILSIILTARILGYEMGIARTICAILFAVIIGMIMSFIYRSEEKSMSKQQLHVASQSDEHPVWQTAVHFFTLVLILVFANVAPADNGVASLWQALFAYKWYIVGCLAIVMCWILVRILHVNSMHVAIGAAVTSLSVLVFRWLLSDILLVAQVSMCIALASLSVILLFDKCNADNREWAMSSWEFAKQIMPLLAIGVVTAGFLLGSTHDETSIAGIIPPEWIEKAVGGNSFLSNFLASFTGAFMYFATLTEVPVIQGMLASGMGKGPALALLLSGPSLSLPNMLVIRDVMGSQKTFVYVALVILMSTLSGYIYGTFF